MNRQQWNQLGKVFQEEVCDIVREETNDEMKRYVAAAKLPKNATLVDFGCGVGTFIKRFGGRFKEIVGVEFAATTIAQAKVLCADMPNVRWMTADIVSAAKKIGGQHADLTVCLNVITSPSATKRAALWQSLCDVTKPGGFTLIVVPSLESEAMVQRVIQGKTLRLAANNGLVVREEATQKHFEENEIRETLGEYGFTVKKLGRAAYPWSIEGVRETPARAANRPWDWVCLAQRGS